MPEYQTIADLLQDSGTDLYFDKLPTATKHESTARSILNRLIDENGEWFPAAAALSIYPIQKWAQVKRSELGIDVNALSEEDYFGIRTAGRFQNQRVSLQETDREIDLVTEILSSEKNDLLDNKTKPVLNAVHGIGKADVSKYMLENYYENALRKVFERYWDKFRTLNLEMIKGIDTDDYEGVYHNTELLVRQLNAIDGMRSSRWSDVQYENASETIIRCIDALKSYSDEGETLQVIAESYARGEPEMRIAEKMNKSRTYVRARYRYAIEILSYLIWGYSTREVLRPLMKRN